MCCCVLSWAVPNSLKEHVPFSSGSVQQSSLTSQKTWIFGCIVLCMIVLLLGSKLKLLTTTQYCVLNNGNGQHRQWIKNILCCLGITPLCRLVNGHWDSGVCSVQSRAPCHVVYLDVWPWKLLHFLDISKRR